MNHDSLGASSKQESSQGAAGRASMSANSYLKTESIPPSGLRTNEEYTIGNRMEEPDERRSEENEPKSKEVDVVQSSGRASNPEMEDSIFRVENGGFYAYSGAFETFNNVAGASQSSMGINIKHATLLQIQTSRSAEGSQLKSDRSTS